MLWLIMQQSEHEQRSSLRAFDGRVVLRDVIKADAERLAQIYNYYIENTIVTFETELVSSFDFEDRLAEHPDNLPWLVIEEQGRVIGYCYAAPWKQRNAYAHSVETSIYLDVAACGKGFGKLAYSHLLSLIDNYHAVIGGIALPNDASVALHESLGYRKVANFAEIGHKFGRWIDVGYWQLLPGKERQ